MIDIASDLKARFDWAMYLSLEAYEVLPDEKSCVRSDDDKRAIGLFRNLHDSVDELPASLIRTAEAFRTDWPEDFERWLVHGVQAVGFGFFPANATEFLQALNNTVQREKEAAN